MMMLDVEVDECDDNDDEEDKHYHYVLYQKVSRGSNIILGLVF